MILWKSGGAGKKIWSGREKFHFFVELPLPVSTSPKKLVGEGLTSTITKGALAEYSKPHDPLWKCVEDEATKVSVGGNTSVIHV